MWVLIAWALVAIVSTAVAVIEGIYIETGNHAQGGLIHPTPGVLPAKQVLMLPLKQDGPYPYKVLVKAGEKYVAEQSNDMPYVALEHGFASIGDSGQLVYSSEPRPSAYVLDASNRARNFKDCPDELKAACKATGGHPVLIQYTETTLKPSDEDGEWSNF